MESMEYEGEKGRGREWEGGGRRGGEGEGGRGRRGSTTIVAEGGSEKSSMPDVTIS